jgi:hypothetical protein
VLDRLSLLMLVACTPQPQPTLPPSPANNTDTDTDTDTDTVAAVADEALFRGAVDGSLDAAAALAQIGERGGFPVETSSGTWLFGCFCGEGDWYLAGDHDDWSGALLTRAGDLHWIEATILVADGSGYKFTDLDSTWSADPLARRYNYDDYGEYSLVRSSAAHLERWVGVSYGALLPRELFVWVPDAGTYTHLLLAHDGQNLFNPAAIWGGWRLQESLPPGVLVVGVENTAARLDEYTHTTDTIHGTEHGGAADAYLDMLDGAVRPLAESAYGSPEVVGVMGSSLGGLVSFYAAWRNPDRYDMAISLSGTMGWGSIGQDGETIIDLYAASGHQDVALFLDSGGDGPCEDTDGDGISDDSAGSSDNYCENIQLRDVLDSIGYTFGNDLWHWHAPGEPHNEAAWAARVSRPLDAFSAL